MRLFYDILCKFFSLFVLGEEDDESGQRWWVGRRWCMSDGAIVRELQRWCDGAMVRELQWQR